MIKTTWSLALLLLVALCQVAHAQECTAYSANSIDFNNTIVNGTLITNPQGQIIINNYIQPTEDIDEINRQLAVLRALQQTIIEERLSNEKQMELIRQKEAEMKISQAEIDREKRSVLMEKETVTEMKNNFHTAFNQAKLEFQILQNQIPPAATNNSAPTSPIESLIQEKITQAQQIIQSTELCIAHDFEVIPIKDTQTGKITYAFSLEEIRNDPNYILIDDYSEGLARVKRSNKYGYYDQKGALVVDFKYDYAESFRNGRAVVKNIGKWSLIDTAGSTVLAFDADIVNVSSIPSAPLTYLCKGRQGTYLANEQGERLSEYYQNVAPFDANGYAVASNTQKGIINTKGQVVVPCLYNEVATTGDARYIRVKDTYYGIYDTLLKKEALACVYSHIPDVVAGLGIVTDNLQQKCIIDDAYRQLTPCIFKTIQPFDTNGHAYVQDMGGRWGVIDQSGAVVTGCSLKEVPVFVDGVAIVQSDDGFGLMDSEKKIVIPTKYTQLFRSGVAHLLIFQSNSRFWGIINTAGNIIVKAKYTGISPFDQMGLAVITLGVKQGLMDTLGRVVLEPTYDEIKAYTGTNFKLIRSGQLYGLLDSLGSVLFEPAYDEIQSYGRTNYTPIRLAQQYGLLDARGRVVLDPTYDEIKAYAGTNYKLIRPGQLYGLLDVAQKQEVIKPLYKEIKGMMYGLIVGDKGNYTSDWFYFDNNGKIQPVTILRENMYPFDISQFHQKELSPDLHLYQWRADNMKYLLFNPKSLRLAYLEANQAPTLNRYGQVVISSYGSLLLLDANLLPLVSTNYYCIEPGDDNTYLVCKNTSSNVGYIYTTGELIIDYLYSSGSQPFVDGSAIVAKGRNYGVVNINGLEFIPVIFEKVERVANGFKVFKGETVFEVTTEGKCLSTNKETYAQLVRDYHKQR